MIQISHIVKKWREGVEQTSPKQGEEGETQRQKFERGARELMQRLSLQYEQEREASKKKFSEWLGQLAEEDKDKEKTTSSPKVEAPKAVAPEKKQPAETPKQEETPAAKKEEAAPVSPPATEKKERSATPSFLEDDEWDEDMQDFTQGLFEEDPGDSPSATSPPTKKKQEETESSNTKKESKGSDNPKSQHKNSSEETSSKKGEKSRTRKGYSSGSSSSKDEDREDQSFYIENVIKSMGSGGERPGRHTGKRRRDNYKKKDKKGSRHKWI